MSFSNPSDDASSQYKPSDFFEIKEKYDRLCEDKTMDNVLDRIDLKHDLTNCARYLAKSCSHLPSLTWLCEQFVYEDTAPYLMTEFDFKTYVRAAVSEHDCSDALRWVYDFYVSEKPPQDEEGAKPFLFSGMPDVMQNNIPSADTQGVVHTFEVDFDEEEPNATPHDAPLNYGGEVNTGYWNIRLENEAQDKSRKNKWLIRSEEGFTFTKDDMNTVMQPFEDLIGLAAVKEQVKMLCYTMIADSKRREKNIHIPYEPSLHMAFTGNPGTGKTTVARLIGSALKECGYLTHGHVIEVDRSALVGQYIGHTEKIISQFLKDARGGVLFIDEAYELNKGCSIDFGEEVIARLVKVMEDQRDNLVVIFAGYQEQMSWLIDSNPGLRSRLSSIIHFEDYTPDESVAIFEKHLADLSFKLDPFAKQKLQIWFRNMSANDRDKFGNGRGVRNLMEQAIKKQSYRIVEQDIEDADALVTIVAQDLCFNETGNGGSSGVVSLH